MNGIENVSGIVSKDFSDISFKHCSSVLDEIKSYVPKEIPEEPFELRSFNDRPQEYKSSNNEKFYSQDFIKEYLGEKWSAELYNRDCFLRLLELRKGCLGDLPVLREIGIKIAVFAKAIKANSKPFSALRVFVDREIIEPKAQEVDWTE